MTGADREEGAKIRALLQETLINRMNLRDIENAHFAICLDDQPSCGGNFAAGILRGDPDNRWFDKSIQVVASLDGELGVNIEHAGNDAGIWAYLLRQVDGLLMEGIKENSAVRPMRARCLRWEISAPLAGRLMEAKEEHIKRVGAIPIAQRTVFTPLREEAKRAGHSPDALVQILFQAAYYRMSGRFSSVYEAVSTRAFYQGRTECARPCTKEAADFIGGFVGGGAKRKVLKEKLELALRAHIERIFTCQKGMGVHRHISGLMAMYEIYGKKEGLREPPFFHDEGYRVLCHDTLSTSGITAPCIEAFGFGPVVEDGLGIGYGLKKELLQLVVTAGTKSPIAPEDFIDTLINTAPQLLAILKEEA